MGDALHQGVGDSVAVGKTAGDDGPGRDAEMVEQFYQDGSGGDAVCVIVADDHHGHVPLKGAADDEIGCGRNPVDCLGGDGAGGEKFLLAALCPG